MRRRVPELRAARWLRRRLFAVACTARGRLRRWLLVPAFGLSPPAPTLRQLEIAWEGVPGWSAYTFALEVMGDRIDTLAVAMGTLLLPPLQQAAASMHEFAQAYQAPEDS